MSTVEDIDSIWKDDLLGRREDAEFLKNFLLNRIDERGSRELPRSYVLNLDAPWGKGKSYFLERFSQHLKVEGFLVVSVNAWRDDYAEDPLVAVMSAIDSEISPLIERNEKSEKIWRSIKKNAAAVALSALKGAALHWTRKAVGDGLDAALGELEGAKDSEAVEAAEESLTKEISKIVEGQAEILISSFEETQNSVLEFRQNLGTFLSDIKIDGKQTPLFIFVDELDRCRPTYAIALLERVKHLFDIDDVIFLVATNTEQLCHSIGAVYGNQFDSQRYLNRFFDRSYEFDEPTLKNFVDHLLATSAIDIKQISLPPRVELSSFIADFLSALSLSLRDAQQCLDILQSVMTVWRAPVKVEIILLLPMIVAQQQGIPPYFEEKFVVELQNSASAQHDSNKPWCFDFYTTRTPGKTPALKSLSGFDIMTRIIRLAEKPIFDILGDNQKEDENTRWVYRIFQDEMGLIHGNQISSGQKLYSIIREYPGYVRSAGRLLTTI